MEYYCKDGYKFDDGTKKVVKAKAKGVAVGKSVTAIITPIEPAEVVRRISICNESKLWDPPILSCIGEYDMTGGGDGYV